MLANSLRPHSLEKVIGQDKVVKSLKNSFLEKDIPNCMIFCGNSGSGKNTIAYIVAETLLCTHTKLNQNNILEPCHECLSCKSIESETFTQDNLLVYNGKTMSAEDIGKLEEKLSYAPLSGKRVVLINEAQGVASLSKLLEIIETPRNNTYFIFTSTDFNKFKNLGKKDNKAQEQAAFRSRVAYYQINPISSKDIASYLFDLVSSQDKGNIPESFYTEGIHLVAENVKGNLRQAINDILNLLRAETYETKEFYNLLGYEDEREHIELLSKFLNKDKSFIGLLLEEDIQAFFYYSWAILNEASLYTIDSSIIKEEWKAIKAIELIQNPNFDDLIKLYEVTNSKCPNYFNEKVFLDEIYRFYKNPIGINTVRQPVKRIPKNG